MTHIGLINDAIDPFKQEILMQKDIAEILTIKDPVATEFHMLPKIHKTKTL